MSFTRMSGIGGLTKSAHTKRASGETFEVRVAGYCTSIDKLISDFSERVLRSTDAEDLESVLTALKDAQDACKALLTEAVKEGAIN